MSAPTAVARARSVPFLLIVAPMSWSPGPFVHGQALAGHGGLVDLALTLLDDRVDGQFRPRADEQQVPDDDLGRGHLDRFAVAQHHRLGRGEVEQRADGVVRAAAGTHLEPVAEQHERGEHPRRLVEDVALDEERRRDRVDPGRADGHGDEHHHVQRPRPQRGKRAGEEDRGGVQDHRQTQKQQPRVTVDGERRGKFGAEQLGAHHRPEHDRDREHQRDQEPVAHVARHRRHRHPGVTAVAVTMGVLGPLRRGRVVGLVATLLREGVADMPRHRLAGAVIAALLDPLPQPGDGRLLRVEGHRRGLRDRVGVDREHARPVAEDALDDRLLAGVVQPADVQDAGDPVRLGVTLGSLSGCVIPARPHHHPSPSWRPQ